MSKTTESAKIGSLKDLEGVAQTAAAELSKVSGHNAVWDKTLKVLKPGLADLENVFRNAKNESVQADTLIKEVEASYDSRRLQSIVKAREKVDTTIKELKATMLAKAQDLQTAKDNAVSAQNLLDKSAAEFDSCQKELLGLPKQIQEGQKALAALAVEIKDANSKNQLVEAIVKLEDLRIMIRIFKEDSKPECEAALWSKLNHAADVLLTNIDNLPVAQGKVPDKEKEYNAAKATYETAQKSRLDSIKEELKNNA